MPPQPECNRSFVTEDGVRLEYRDEGQGVTPLVFIHGWCSNLRDWEPQAQFLGANHRVIRYDRRGHGGSDAPAAGYTPEGHARDLGQLLAHLEVEEAVLVAHAGGAPTAMALAAGKPALVRALALVEANLYTPDDQRQRTTLLMGALREADSTQVFMMAYRRFLHPRCDASLAARVVGEAARTPARVMVAELEGLVVDTGSMARAIQQPVLWIAAVPRVGFTDGAGVARVFPDVRYGQVFGAAHFPQLEVPGQVSAMLAHFIESEPVATNRT